MNEQTLQGHWNEIKGGVQKKWGQITEDDLRMAQGDVDRLIGTIQRKTGEGREAIMKFMEETAGISAGTLAQVMESVRGYAQQASEQSREQAQAAMEAARQGYESTEELVRQRPMESMLTCFGVGVLTGVVVGLMVRR
ncbi:MAG TPA: CsbD family protein [Pirellulaceae bacterium]|jgi:uncharacterized protein YjbJ (UPF0337 family)|nr:CsbD family protein [Pirellulaceae bacterium]